MLWARSPCGAPCHLSPWSQLERLYPLRTVTNFAPIPLSATSSPDAAVTTALCLGVLHPASSGIGGGAFILIYNATTKCALLENAPWAAG